MKRSSSLNFESVRALVIGDVILDHYLVGKVERISPEAPVPVVHVTSERYVLGGSANVAANLSKLKAKAHLYGAVGHDKAADELKSLCEEAGIEAHFLKATMPTIRKTRVIGGKQQIVRIDWEDKFSEVAASLEGLAQVFGIMPNVIVLSDYGKGMVSDELAFQTISYTNSHHIPLVVDPKGVNWDKYRHAFIVTPNLSELAAVVGEKLPNTNEAVTQAGQAILARYELQHLLVTRSENGMTLISTHEVLHFPSQKVEVFDVSGAGDTVVAVLAAGLASGLSLSQATEWANKAGGYVVSKFGTYAISAEELAGL
jgi:D-glycero-beta-D-manno-heptose-7-phosphate kinase